ncbi:uncharacterized protein [Parasteatoda tepidariorum]|uniref:uncharacterized protein n=1 Tax=Parasteatoda tepidariorum TaxID=114398 RepID=UPI001C71EE80|nr:uncharacterized protein LOC122272783 [Parasteatoda tepidariorum]
MDEERSNDADQRKVPNPTVQSNMLLQSFPTVRSVFDVLRKQFEKYAVKQQSSENISSNEYFNIDKELDSNQYDQENLSLTSEKTSIDANIHSKDFNNLSEDQVLNTKTIHQKLSEDENRKYQSHQVRTSGDSSGNSSWNIFNKTKNNAFQNESKDFDCQELFSHNRSQYVTIEKKLGKLHYSGSVVLNFSDVCCQLSFGTVGVESFLVVNCVDSKNCDPFVARIEISDKEELNYSLPFHRNKKKLFELITITKIYEDGLLFKRNEAYDNFVLTLKERAKNISDDFSCKEDFIQLLKIVRSHNLSLDQPLILLKEIIQIESISNEVKDNAEHLRHIESKLSTRNHNFPKFSAKTDMLDLFGRIRNICMEGIDIHRKNLINECPNKSFKLVCLVVNVNNLLDKKILFISKKDIKLFADLLEFMNEQYPNERHPTDFVKNLWSKFFKRIEVENQNKSLKQLGSITHPIYFFLLKSLYDTVSDIRSKNANEVETLISFNDGDLVTVEFITWSTNDPLNKSLEQQYLLMCKLIKFFEPGIYFYQNNFNYTFKLLKGDEDVSLWETVKNLSLERLIWLYIVDSSLEPILCDNSAVRFKELSLPVLNGFVKFIQDVREERHETCRVATHNIIQFVSRISPYISTIYSVLTSIDHSILNKQIDVISSILIAEDRDTLSDHFATLLMIYNEYWDHRDSIVGKLPIPCSIFKSDVESVMKKLLEIVQNAFFKEIDVSVRIKFLRLYNEFLKHLQGINFQWFMSKFSYFPELEGAVEEVSKNDVTSYRVIEPEDFVEIFMQNEKPIPKHFLLEAVKKLLDVVRMSLDKVGWSDEDSVKSAGDLLLAVGHSFTHFEDQVDYRDLEHFLRDCTLPFYCVVQNSHTYWDFKRRLDNVENFYVYVRKQNQIGIQVALNLCEQEVSKAKKSGFETMMDKTILEDCYDRYSKKLLSLENFEISEILNDMEDQLKKVKKLPLHQWSSNFKLNSLPVLLANLAAVWSLQESEDVSGIKKKIEPHCVQILCIFRLLRVDKDSVGVPKHFAQVLTGQGKSLILALISALVALTGSEACIVCYSDYLAQRDKTRFKSFFETFHRFNVGNKVSYNTFEYMAKETLLRKVDGVVVSLASVIQDLVLNNLTTPVVSTIQKFERVLLIDEVDVFFSEDFYGTVFSPIVGVAVPALLKIQPKIWDIVQNGVLEKNNILEQISVFISELLKDENYVDFRHLLKTTSVLFEKELERMVIDAIYVFKNADRKGQFKINQQGSICFKDKYFQYRTKVYVSYQNSFNYFRLKKENYDDNSYSNFGYLLLKMGSISYASLPLRYQSILGVSGTLLNLNDSEKNSLKNYGIQTLSAMPSFFGERKLVFTPSSMYLF